MKRSLAVGMLVVVALLGTTACSSDSASTSAGASGGASAAGSTAAIPADAVVIDVRTPAEYSAGHLEGAQNINVESSDFVAEVGALPKSGTYVVYCRSGNRSAVAAQQMGAIGFKNVIDAGSVSEASSATGLPVVN